MNSEITDAEVEAFLQRERSRVPPPISPLPDRQSEGEKDLAALSAIGGIYPLHADAPYNLEVACEAYPLTTILPVLVKYGKDAKQDDLKRLWPWVASAVISWRITFELAAISNNISAGKGAPKDAPWYFEPKLKPSEIKSRLDRIGKNARQIVDDIRELTQAARATNPHQQRQARHLASVLTAMNLGVDYDFDLEQFGRSEPSADIIAKADACRVELQSSLGRLATLSSLLADKLDSAELTHQKPGTDPALPVLVGSLAHVWKAMRGKSPSISRPKLDGAAQASPFTKFVLEVAAIGQLAPQGTLLQSKDLLDMPTADTVDTAVRNLRK